MKEFKRAILEGIPKKIINGVNKNPPPIPTIPIIIPTKDPTPRTVIDMLENNHQKLIEATK